MEAIIARIADEHSSNSFWYFTPEDLHGEIWIICLEALPEFEDSKGKLEHFLRVSVKNRLINKFKEVTKSIRNPCTRCVLFNNKDENDCNKIANAGTLINPTERRTECDKWRKYQQAFQQRNSMLNTFASSDDTRSTTDSAPYSDLIGTELYSIIEKNLSPQLLPLFKELISGGNISKDYLFQIQTEVLSILEETGGYSGQG